MAMTYSTPKVISNGVVAYYDPANRKSSSTPTIVGSNISSMAIGRKAQAIDLLIGCSYDSARSSFAFDGVDDYLRSVVSTTQPLSFNANEPFSGFAWINATNGNAPTAVFGYNWYNSSSSPYFGGWGLVIEKGNNGNTHVIRLMFSTNFVGPIHNNSIHVATSGTNILSGWVQLGFTYNPAISPSGYPTSSSEAINAVKFYLNGNEYTQTKSIYVNGAQPYDGFDTGPFVNYESTVSIGTRIWIGGAAVAAFETQGSIYGSEYIGSIGPVLIYDRVLSASEITNNYLATKARFGHT